MKKALSLILALIFVLPLLVACGNGGSGDGAAKTGEFKTLGDIIGTPGVEEQQTATVDNDKFVFVYKLNDIYYRAIATITEEQDEAIWALDMFADDYETKRTELMSPLVIGKIENLSEMEPSQEELDQWVGKTGEELMEAGWTNSGWNLGEMVFWMNYGPLQYDVVMEGTVEDVESFVEDDINALVVKSVTYNGQLGDATNIDE